MFKYSEHNIFERCGSADVPFHYNLKPESTGKEITVSGEKIPIINYHFQSGVKFSRQLCLKTFLGYIPINNIETIKDIFRKSNYVQDDEEWIHQYSEENAHNIEKEAVKKLALRLRKHWKQ